MSKSKFEASFARAMRAAGSDKKTKQERAMEGIRASEEQAKQARLAAAASGGPPACPECGQNVPVVGGRFVEHTTSRSVTPRDLRSWQCQGGGRRNPHETTGRSAPFRHDADCVCRTCEVGGR